MAKLHIVSLPGDGVGPEVTGAMLQVLEAVAAKHGHEVSVDEHLVGWCAYEAHGAPMTDATLEACKKGPAVFLGAVGDPRADGLPPSERPEAALLKLRSTLGCFANLRPARVDPELVAKSALRKEVASGADLVIVRELTGGLYYGEPRGRENGRAVNTLVYTEEEVARVARVAFQLARNRRKHVTSIDKANVLEVSQLWRAVVDEVAKEYDDVQLEHMLVDRAAMELVTYPTRFDVMLMENLFGDILSDEASAMCGSLGLLASASVGGTVGLYEPVHGSAPDIAGKGIANPIAAIRSAALMLSYSFELHEEAAAIERGVSRALADGLRTKDIAGPGETPVSTNEFARAVAEAVA
ncbi:MAG: 3-isopropylmalate dehydrogenase [Thermoanaerobaculia bacterium]|nr:3-isopropylmalate dehydrogenase [Thermoanaerobaculia bacterium]